jgi:hypothetical protein
VSHAPVCLTPPCPALDVVVRRFAKVRIEQLLHSVNLGPVSNTLVPCPCPRVMNNSSSVSTPFICLTIAMGARLSQPRGPAGTTESSVPTSPGPPPSPKRPFPRTINSRTIMAPAAAFTMACLLFVYARTSIRAAKANAQRHREADSVGEGLSLLNEHRQRHGRAERLDKGGNTVVELANEAKEQLLGVKRKGDVGDVDEARTGRSEEERLRALRGKGVRKSALEND